MSFMKFVNLFVMKMPFSAKGLLGGCSKMGLLSLMLFILLLVRVGKT